MAFYESRNCILLVKQCCTCFIKTATRTIKSSRTNVGVYYKWVVKKPSFAQFTTDIQTVSQNIWWIQLQ